MSKKLLLIVSAVILVVLFCSLVFTGCAESYENVIKCIIYEIDKVGCGDEHWNGNALINSRTELEEFVTEHMCQMISWTKKDGTIVNDYYYKNWLDEYDHSYDDEFFDKYALVSILFTVNSGSYSYSYIVLQKDEGKIILTLQDTSKGTQHTDDMAYWKVFLAIDKEYAQDNPEVVLQFKDKK